MLRHITMVEMEGMVVMLVEVSVIKVGMIRMANVVL